MNWSEIFIYDETSPTSLRWKDPYRKGNRGVPTKRNNDCIAGGVTTTNTLAVTVNRSPALVSKIVWEMHNGSLPSGRAYIGCTVHEDWHNFQNFAEWAYKKPQAWFMEGDKIWELDKDSLVEGNKVYCADRCTFLPPELNIFFSDSTWSEDCPRGVNYIKPASANAKEGWIARCNMNGERKYGST